MAAPLLSSGLGERTRQLDGAHVEFLRGVANPLGIKVSEKMDPWELVKLCEILNPHNKPGRLTIINRMGAENMRVMLPHLIRAVRQAGLIVTWVSDPVHGNTMKAPSGLKTRSFDAIMAEIRAFFDVHEQEGNHPGGVHLEMTGQNVRVLERKISQLIFKNQEIFPIHQEKKKREKKNQISNFRKEIIFFPSIVVNHKIVILQSQNLWDL